MKKCLFLAVGLALCCQVRAQQAPTAPLYTRADSTQAVQRLFAKHRTGGWIWTTVGGLLAVRIITVAATSNTDAAAGTPAGTAVGVGVLGGVPAGIGIGKLVRFSPARETAVLAAYAQGLPLPAYVRQRLKKKHFPQAAQ